MEWFMGYGIQIKMAVSIKSLAACGRYWCLDIGLSWDEKSMFLFRRGQYQNRLNRILSKQEQRRSGLEFRDQVKFLIDQYKGLTQANKQLKEAGASYQKSLTADTRNLSRYTTDEQLAGMAGVYTFDAGYAALFLQKKEMGKFW